MTEAASTEVKEVEKDASAVRYVVYEDETQLPWIQALMEKDLSEPYSVFTYRYFVNNWPDLCFLAMAGEKCIGAIVCKLGRDKKRKRKRGYIAMLAVDHDWRGKKIGSALVQRAIQALRELQAEMVVLETEVSNKAALALYEKLNFVRDKRLQKYYLNGGDAFRLKYYLSTVPDT